MICGVAQIDASPKEEWFCLPRDDNKTMPHLPTATATRLASALPAIILTWPSPPSARSGFFSSFSLHQFQAFYCHSIHRGQITLVISPHSILPVVPFHQKKGTKRTCSVVRLFLTRLSNCCTNTSKGIRGKTL